MKQIILVTILSLILVAPLMAGNQIIEHDIFIFENQLTVDFDFENLFDQNLLTEIKYGYPLHIKLTVSQQIPVQLWFDKTELSKSANISLEYQKFGSRYSLNLKNFSGETSQQLCRDIQIVIEEINEQLILQLGTLDRFNLNQKYYFSFKLELRRLTAREINRASDWYQGKPNQPPDSSQAHDNLPEYLFDQLLNVSGLGPRKFDFDSQVFKIKHLKAVTQ